jgi:hypothetical protein
MPNVKLDWQQARILCETSSKSLDGFTKLWLLVAVDATRVGRTPEKDVDNAQICTHPTQ